MLLKKYAVILYMMALCVPMGCAWENLPEGGVKTEQVVRVTMRLGGSMDPKYFYYIVFNLSGNPAKKPYSVFDGLDRGRNWSIYYVWGTPPYRDTDVYRGLGSIGASRKRRIDEPPVEMNLLNELLPGSVVEGDHMTLRIRISDLGVDLGSINMNMIVCNQAIDGESRLYYTYDPYVFDSFYERGITMNLKGTEDLWDEVQIENQQESTPNEHELTAPPETNIIGWRFQIENR
jgi:hypothetical protein